MYTDSNLTDARANGKERASPLVSTLASLLAVRTPVFSASRPKEIVSGEAFLLTSWWQTSRDLVEEWIALGRKPLCAHTDMSKIVELNGYKGPVLRCPKDFADDRSFVHFVEKEAEKICGVYALKEQRAKNASLGTKRRLNRIFNLMGVAYEDRPILAEDQARETETSDVAACYQTKPVKRAIIKQRICEPDFVRIGCQLVKPVRQNQKVCFALGEFTGEASSIDRVSVL